MALVADIHFNYKLAIAAIEAGADKIRINPGNIGSDQRVKMVVDAAASANIPIRIGVNSGSLEKKLLQKYGGPSPEALLESAQSYIAMMNSWNFPNIIISIGDVLTTVKACRHLPLTVLFHSILDHRVWYCAAVQSAQGGNRHSSG